MDRLEIEAGEGGVPYRLYDLTIADMNERKAKAILKPTASEAIKYLGVAHSTFYKNRHPGKRVYSIIHDRYFAVRIAK